MKLVHFSRIPLGTIMPVPQTKPAEVGYDYWPKPQGLWVSDEATGDGWKAWCESAEFDGCGPFAHHIVLKPNHKVLLVGEQIALERFNDRYSKPVSLFEGFRSRGAVDWAAVAADWQGVIISPYRWDKRMDDQFFWYYGWDCASGCIWNPEAIAEVTLITETQ